MIAQVGPKFTFDEEKHEYRFDGNIIPHPTGVLSIYNKFDKIPKQKLENARDFGNTVHLYQAAYNNGTLDIEAELPKNIEGPDRFDMNAIVNGWDMQFRGEVYFARAVEKRCFSRKLLYGCTIDLVAYNDFHNIIDFKPMSCRKKKSVGVQLAANAGAAFEEGLVEWDKIRLVSWHYDALGRWVKEIWDFKYNWNIWMCLLTAYNHEPWEVNNEEK